MHFDTLNLADSSVRKAQQSPPHTIATAQDLHGSFVPSIPQASESQMAAKAKAWCMSPRFTHNKHKDECHGRSRRHLLYGYDYDSKR